MSLKNKLFSAFIIACFLALCLGAITIFFDQAVLTRGGTTWREPIQEKVVALTFDDGPSQEWTPRILQELRTADVKATFFMLGKHVAEFPEIARQVAEEGHEIGNHTYDHRLLPFSPRTMLPGQVNACEKIIKETTGITTHLFRPPKAWLTPSEKRELRELGYTVVLWSLNSKDWVNFDDKYIIAFLLHHIRPGDIILFHDAGGVFGTEGGSREETVQTIAPLVKKLRERGYRFATVSELMALGKTSKTEKK